MIEKTLRLTEANGHSEFVVIIDRHGTTRANDDISFLKQFTVVLSNNYPERMGSMLVVEVNWILKILFFIVRQFLSQRQVDKI